MSTLTTFIQHSFGRSSYSNQRRKEVKWIQIGKEEVKLSLVADNMILYIEDPKGATRKLLKLINEFSKDSGYIINTQKSITFLYTNNERSEREIKEAIPFTISSKRRNHLGINPRRRKTWNPKTIRHRWKNWRWHKQMERYTMFLDWENQYCQNDYIIQSNI